MNIGLGLTLFIAISDLGWMTKLSHYIRGNDGDNRIRRLFIAIFAKNFLEEYNVSKVIYGVLSRSFEIFRESHIMSRLMLNELFFIRLTPSGADTHLAFARVIPPK